jgi:hypothetical protein
MMKGPQMTTRNDILKRLDIAIADADALVGQAEALEADGLVEHDEVVHMQGHYAGLRHARELAEQA